MWEYICICACGSYYGLFCSMVTYTLCKERYQNEINVRYRNINRNHFNTNLETVIEINEY